MIFLYSWINVFDPENSYVIDNGTIVPVRLSGILSIKCFLDSLSMSGTVSVGVLEMTVRN